MKIDMKKQIRFFILTFLFTCTNILMAQPVTVKAKMDSTSIFIGNQTGLTFEIVQLAKQKVILPIFSDTIVGNLEIVEQAKLDTVKLSEDKIQVNLHYKVSSFEDSLLYVPGFPFVTGNDTSWSNSLSLKVIQPFKIDTTSNTLTDIKPVLKPKFVWINFFQKLLLILLILALGFVLFILIRKFVMKKPIFHAEQPKIVVPPHVEALASLDKIRSEKLWQHGRVKEYHTELTDTLRIYIEKVFNINSMEMTSDEILREAEFLKSGKPSSLDALRQILQLADLVKFAKWNPSPGENELSLINAYLFVNQTIVEDAKTPEVTKDEQN